MKYATEMDRKRESVDTLAAGVAHDFNNLLVSVLGNASLAQEFLPADNPAAGLLQGIIQAGQKAAVLTRQMLACSGEGRFLVEAVNLSDFVAEMGPASRDSLPPNVALRLELEAELPSIQADRGQMRQVLWNLLLNAAEATGDGGGEVVVRTGVENIGEWAELPPGRYVRLEVRDAGCGMDEATRARIFDPFFSTKFTGRGLGLAAVAGIVRGQKGAIFVASAPGEGACFTVLLPVDGAGRPLSGA